MELRKPNKVTYNLIESSIKRLKRQINFKIKKIGFLGVFYKQEKKEQLIRNLFLKVHRICIFNANTAFHLATIT